MGTISISQSVGRNGANSAPDVRSIQSLINRTLFKLTPLAPLTVDGDCGPLTVGLICEFQSRVLNFTTPDGRVDPDGKTLASLNDYATGQEKQRSPPSRHSHQILDLQQWLKNRASSPKTSSSLSKSLTEEDYKRSARSLGIEVAIIKAVALIESQGSGFLDNGEPKILFEGHWFHRFTDGKYDKQYPSISYPRWTKAHYLGGSREYSRYRQAFSLNQEAAMKSTSWGKFQIMGFNHRESGYPSVHDFVADMRKSEGHQLRALVRYIESRELAILLRNKSWSKFAHAYNGPRYAENQYDLKLERAYKSYAGTH